jgi:hypothetical protein
MMARKAKSRASPIRRRHRLRGDQDAGLTGKGLAAALASGSAAVITAAVVVLPGGTYQAAGHLGPPSRTDLAVDPRPDPPTDTPTRLRDTRATRRA